MIPEYLKGYKRAVTKFEWCGQPVWLVKLTQADHEAIWGTDTSTPKDDSEDKARLRNFYIDVLARSLVNEAGEFVASNGEAEDFFRTKVALDDLTALGRLSMRHSGYPVDEEQKKS